MFVVFEPAVLQVMVKAGNHAGRTTVRQRLSAAFPQKLNDMRDELLDHVAARAAQDPALNDETARAALRTAAECSLGALSVGCFPNGDQEILFPLIDGQLSSENIAHRRVRWPAGSRVPKPW